MIHDRGHVVLVLILKILSISVEECRRKCLVASWTKLLLD